MDAQGDGERLAESLEKFCRKADELMSGSRNTARIDINAGGTGVWIATTACCVMVAITLFMGLWLVEMSRKVDRMQDHLNAIYMMAPSLKSEE